MIVLQVLPELKSGGVERGTVDLAKYLLQHRHGSIVVSAGGALVNDLTAAGVKHFTLPVHRKSPLSIARSVKALSRIVREEKVDVIHARSRVPAIVAYFVSKRTHVPFVTTCHGFYKRHLLSYVMGWGKIVIVASHIIGRRMRDDFGVAFEKLRLIPRGVDLGEFAQRAAAPDPKQDPIVIGLVGRLTPIKGHPLFLKAMARVVRVFPNAKAQIIGDSPKPQYKEELQSLVRRLGLGRNVDFLGTRYDIADLLGKMSVLAVPSVGEEAFGRVAIEAGAVGVPVVAARIGGLVDVIEDGQTGLLVPPDDPLALADAIIRLISDRQLSERLTANFRKKVEAEYPLERMFSRTLDVYHEAVSKKRILVIKLSALGDVILSLPSIAAIRAKFPDAWISVLVGRRSRQVVRNSPHVNDVIVFDEGRKDERVGRALRMSRILARENFDCVVDLQNNKMSHFLAFASGARVRAGHDNRKWSFLLNRRVKDAPTAHIGPLEHQFLVLKQIGVDGAPKPPEFWTSPEEEARMAAFLEEAWVSPSQTVVGINPGSSLQWPTKQWGIENFAKLCDELAKRNMRVILTGSDEERPLADALMDMTRNKPINAVGRTSITELGALIRRCQAFVSSDSAPMHVAAALGVPLVALFGPTDPKRHLVPPPSYQVLWKGVHCSPCYLRSCPIGHICMKKIGVPEVLEATLALVREKRPVLV